MLRRGESFAGYVIEREVGRGGMGSVYAARHPRLPRLIALKILHREMFDQNETRTRFEREADLVAQLDHPNIITVFDRGAEDDQLWIAMQFVDGVDGASVDIRDISPKRAVQIAIQTAGALDYAHARGVLHRDVKPANILLSSVSGAAAGFSERVLLSDFGIARMLDDTAHLTRTGMLNATVAFASPEQISGGPLGPHSDQYSLACTVFRLLTGRGPFDAPTIAAVMLGHLQQPPPSARALRPDLPPGLDEVLARGMAKRPEDRYDSCSEFALAASRTLPSAPVTLDRPPRPPAPRRQAGPDQYTVLNQHSTPESRTFLDTQFAPELRPAPNHHAVPEQRSASDHRPVPDQRPATRSTYDAMLGCLLGGAVGDALGAPIEAMLLRNIQQRYGTRGVTGSPDTYRGRISDETQLTLFTTEALIRNAGPRTGATGATVGLIQEGLLVWLQGQGEAVAPQPYPLRSKLGGYPELMSYRGPTHSTTAAMQKAALRQQPAAPLGTRDNPINDSKGCAAVVRAAPCGFTGSLEYSFELACDAAALTHGNPGGWLPAGTLAATVYGLSRGLDLRTALDRARAELARHRDHEETSHALAQAVRLADETSGPGRPLPDPESVEKLGYGVIGPEALAMAVYAALSAEAAGGGPEQIFRSGVLLSVNHSGDSDATGEICGALLGTRFGIRAIPELWRTRLDAAAVIDRLATEFAHEFGPTIRQFGNAVP